jgi:hypothetical protein
LLSRSRFGYVNQETRLLKITMPENLDYDGLFDDLFSLYTDSAELFGVRTTNLGSLFELSYHVQLKAQTVPKAFIDELRCRNGNLNISLTRMQTTREEL